MARRPLIAANWKMNKTIGDARGFCERVPARRRGPGHGRRRGRDLPAVPRVAAVARPVRGTPSASPPRTCSSRTRARSPARSRPRCCSTPACAAVVLGHSERRQLFGETDEALATQGPGRAALPGLLPILCVGETEERARAPARPRASSAARSRRDLAEVPDEALAAVVIAYEPIWAIGTGTHRDARAGQRRLRLHPGPDRCSKRGRGGARIRIHYGGSVKPGQRRRAARPRRSTARWSAAPASTRATSRRSSRRPELTMAIPTDQTRCQSPDSRSSSSTAGASPSPARATRSRWRGHADLRRALGASTRTRSSPPPATTSACRTGRWATPRSATSTSAPASSSSRTWRGSTTPSPTAASSRTRSLRAACERAVASPRGRLHLIGLVSDGGVHSGWEHIEACIELAAREGVPDLVVHAFTDGRDTSPTGGPAYVEEVSRWLKSAGRYRDRRRPLLRHGPRPPLGAHEARLRRDRPRAGAERRRCRSPPIADAYEAGETDEFVKPTVIGDYDGIAEGDVIITFNFRPDRMRQIVETLGDPGFDAFERGGGPRLDVTTMTEYRHGWSYPIAFPPARAGGDDGGDDLGGGRASAARRRDREVRARHLLLQRRPRGRVAAGRSASSSTPRATSRPTTSSPR